MSRSKSHSRISHLLGGQCGMEITVLLLLTVPLTTASPLRPTHRSDANTVLSGDAVQASGVKRSEDTQEEHAPALKIIPFHSEDKHLDLDALKHNMALKLRPRRAPQRGCQLGTCQLHNLANTLFILSKTSGKDESKKASDPRGYGR
ncbi:protein ADM2-like isoform X2 [Lates japonicus]|uniref:Protein ADM2-like isoform X2 n=1 Tax=Lates japonicus TaxID=270547 RepID=A0AAD3MNI8_LATJO|nr:protein ADM2-like isoform X2 [Lates japonicus]